MVRFLLWFCLAVFCAAAWVKMGLAERILPGSDRAHAEILRIEAYLSEIESLRAQFLQENPDGSLSRGVFYLRRPGRMRFEYAPPVPYLLLSTGDNFIYVDKELQEISHLSLAELPLGFLLSERVRLQSRDYRINAIESEADMLRINIESFATGDVHAIDLVFATSPLQLRQWRVYLGNGDEITVTLEVIEEGVILADSLFRYQPDWQ